MTDDKDRDLEEEEQDEQDETDEEDELEEDDGQEEEEQEEEVEDEGGEEEEEEKPAKVAKKPKKPKKKAKKEKPPRPTREEVVARLRDPRAREAVGEEWGVVKILALIALFVGLLAMLVGIGWAAIVALARPGPLSCLIGGVLLMAYGVVWGIKPMLKQFHGRGAIVVLVAIGLTLAVLLLLIGANALSLTHRIRMEPAKNRYFTLSRESRDVLKKVTKDVDIQLLVTTDPKARRMVMYNPEHLERLMHEYEVASRHIHWRTIDLYKRPELQAQIGESFDAKAVVKCEERREVVSLTQDDNEQPITTAIYHVTDPKNYMVYSLTGHGELRLDEMGGGGGPSCSLLRQSLENVGMKVQEFSLQREGGLQPPVPLKPPAATPGSSESALRDVPAEAKVVMILGPKTPLAQSEIDALKRYLDQRQGGLFIALAPEPGAPDLHEILGTYNVSVPPGFVVDPYKAMERSGTIPIVERPEGHQILTNLEVLDLPLTRAFNVEEMPPPESPYGPQPPQPSATALLKTSGEAWLETKPLTEEFGPNDLKQDPGEERGTKTLAVLIDTKKEKPPTPPGMPEMPEEDQGPGVRIVAVGSYLMLADNYQLPIPGTNNTFVTRAISWLASGEAISIPARKPPTLELYYKPISLILLVILIVIVIPFGTMAAGLVIWWLRR